MQRLIKPAPNHLIFLFEGKSVDKKIARSNAIPNAALLCPITMLQKINAAMIVKSIACVVLFALNLKKLALRLIPNTMQR